MGKKLVAVDNLESWICRESGKIHVDKSMILTPGAKDELSRRGIEIVYVSGNCAPTACRPGCACDACAGRVDADRPETERLILAVAGILKEEYGITDPERLKNLSCHMVRTIRENI